MMGGELSIAFIVEEKDECTSKSRASRIYLGCTRWQSSS